MEFKKTIKDFLIEDYRSYKAVNYSLLKEIANGNFRAVRDGIPERSSTYMDYGSYIDKTIETGKEPEVYTYKHTELTSHSKILVDECIKNNKLFLNVDELVELADKLELWASTKDKEKRRKLVSSDDIITILEREVHRQQGENIISEEDLKLATYILTVLYTHKFSKDILNPSFDTENYKQLALKFNFKGVECKILLDILQVNHTNKTLQPIDLKTGSDEDFLKNFYKYNYSIQGSLYYLGVLNLINKIPELKDYKILPFKFLYIYREKPDLPLVYTITQKAIEKYIEGYEDLKGNHRKGIVDFLEDYKFHKETSIFDMSREVFESNGILNIPDPF